MYRLFCIIICTLCFVSTSLVFAQRDFPEVEKPKPKVKAPTKPRRIVGPVKAQNRGDGVLFVLTDPPIAQVLIKSGNSTVRQGRSKDGEFRTELPPGLYDVEVTSQLYKPFVTKASVQQIGTKPVQADLVPTTGSILIGFSSLDTEVSLLVDGRKPTTVEKRGENQIEIENLSVGIHTLSITHPTIVAWERKVEVGGGATTTVTPKFSLAIVNLIIKSEPGADVFVDDTYYSRIAENGELRILNKLGPGEHAIRVVKDKFETAQLTRRFAVGTDTVEVKLKRKVFSEAFSDSFLGGASEWDLPKTWKVTKGNMRVAGAVVGLLRDQEYADFKASFDVIFANGKGAAWIIRARDKQNYYLFQLVGPKGAAPNMFYSYIVQDGQTKQLKPPEFLAFDLKAPNASFHISVEASGATIKHFIEISTAPQASPRPLSVLKDSTFSSGTMGFTSKDGEEYIIQFIGIEPTK